jgi:hypothetical protein
MTALPPAVKRDFPFPITEPDRNHLTRVLGIPLADHIGRLDRSREVFLRELVEIPSDEWRRLRRPPDFEEVNYEVTPEWAVFHLVEHEAGHAFQISSLKARGIRMLAAQEGRGDSAGRAAAREMCGYEAHGATLERRRVLSSPAVPTSVTLSQALEGPPTRNARPRQEK